MEDVGKWRCKECGAINGVESEVGKVLEHAERRGVNVREHEVGGQREDEADAVVKKEESSEDDVDNTADSPDEGSGADTTPASSTRSKMRQRKKA